MTYVAKYCLRFDLPNAKTRENIESFLVGAGCNDWRRNVELPELFLPLYELIELVRGNLFYSVVIVNISDEFGGSKVEDVQQLF